MLDLNEYATKGRKVIYSSIGYESQGLIQSSRHLLELVWVKEKDVLLYVPYTSGALAETPSTLEWECCETVPQVSIKDALSARFFDEKIPKIIRLLSQDRHRNSWEIYIEQKPSVRKNALRKALASTEITPQSK